ncbi:MAG: hypothetical protein H5T83_02260 [Actinotalea sp.]|nr:hypothetical protein [Actinotalea sp.]
MAVRPHDPDGEPDDGPRDEEQGTARDAQVDREWQEIVARLRGDDVADPASEPGPVPGDRPAGGTPPPKERAPGSPPSSPSDAATGRPPGAPSPTDPRAWTLDPEIEERDSHFEPPDPGPVLGGDPLLTMAWAAVVAAPVLFLLSVTLWRSLPQVLLQVAAVFFVAGLGVLLWRMPHRRGDDDGPGAVV